MEINMKEFETLKELAYMKEGNPYEYIELMKGIGDVVKDIQHAIESAND